MTSNQIAGVDIPGQGVVTFNSYKWNRPETITLPGDSRKSYSYDGFMRLRGITVNGPAGNAIMNYGYTYDQTGNITAKTTGHGNYAYGYDLVYRLTTADNPTGADEAYSYDAAGNRLTAAGVIDQWVYNNNNELKSNDETTFTYDANGNTISRATGGTATRQYGYDTDNRMVSVKDGADTNIAAYGYDPFGRRLWVEN